MTPSYSYENGIKIEIAMFFYFHTGRFHFHQRKIIGIKCAFLLKVEDCKPLNLTKNTVETLPLQISTIFPNSVVNTEQGLW